MRNHVLLTGCSSPQAAFSRVASPFLGAIAVVVLFGVAAQSAYAHYPVLNSATPSCSNGSPVITYTVTSWAPNGPGMEGENPDIQVLFNGVVVDTGAFVDPADSFTNTMPAPAAATSVIVTAFAAGVWGDKYPAGETSNAITVDLSTLNCAPTGTGRFTGGGQQVIMDPPGPGPVELAKGFEVDCDMNPMHENLELNWQGNHFHMDQITSAVCTLVPPPPNPPTAPVNRIDGTGLGSYNNVEGYTVVFTLIDHGEPGAKAGDASGFKVCRTDPANPKMCAIPANIVLDVPLEIIENGNIQAHVDQH